MKTAKLPCGCRYQVGDIERWLELCPKHKAETDELHQRAAREHAAQRELQKL